MMELDHAFTGPDDAPVLVLASSLGTTKAMWEPQVAALSEDWRVLAYDHRGHGASPVPPPPYELEDIARDALELLDANGLERVAFCGLSLGAMVGMWLAAHAPERIASLVTCCTSPYFPDKQPWRDRAQTVLDADSVEPVSAAVSERWLTPGYARERPEVLERLRAMLAAQPATGYAAACGAVERMDLRADLAAIRAPTLVIAGANDRATPPAEHAAVIADGIAGARYELVEPAAHVANVERAEDVTELIRDHIEEAR